MSPDRLDSTIELIKATSTQRRSYRVPGGSAIEHLRAWLAEHPEDACFHSMGQIGKAIGVTPERVRQLMPHWAKARQSLVRKRLADFVEAHPEAMLNPYDGGMTLNQIAAALNVTAPTINRHWYALGFPSKKLMRRCEPNDPFGSRSIIEWVPCECCGKSFAWTVSKERNYRAGQQKYKVCNQLCGIHLRDDRPCGGAR